MPSSCAPCSHASEATASLLALTPEFVAAALSCHCLCCTSSCVRPRLATCCAVGSPPCCHRRSAPFRPPAGPAKLQCQRLLMLLDRSEGCRCEAGARGRPCWRIVQNQTDALPRDTRVLGQQSIRYPGSRVQVRGGFLDQSIRLCVADGALVL